MAAIARVWALSTTPYTRRSLGEILPVTSTRVKSLLYSRPSAPQSTSTKSASADRSGRWAWRAAGPPAARPPRSAGKLEPAAPNSRIWCSSSSATSFSVCSGRKRGPQHPKRLLRIPDRLADLGDLVLVLDLPQLLDQARGGHHRQLRQLLGDPVAQADGHRIGLDGQPADAGRIAPPGPPPGACSPPGGGSCSSSPGHSSLELGGVAAVAQHHLAVRRAAAGSCRRP